MKNVLIYLCLTLCAATFACLPAFAEASSDSRGEVKRLRTHLHPVRRATEVRDSISAEDTRSSLEILNLDSKEKKVRNSLRRHGRVYSTRNLTVE